MPPNPWIPRHVPGADWDEGNWPMSAVDPMATRRKQNLMDRFFLRDADMADLTYEPEADIGGGAQEIRRYSVRDAERRAWQIYGGPVGLDAQRRMRLGGLPVHHDRGRGRWRNRHRGNPAPQNGPPGPQGHRRVQRGQGRPRFPQAQPHQREAEVIHLDDYSDVEDEDAGGYIPLHLRAQPRVNDNHARSNERAPSPRPIAGPSNSRAHIHVQGMEIELELTPGAFVRINATQAGNGNRGEGPSTLRRGRDDGNGNGDDEEFGPPLKKMKIQPREAPVAGPSRLVPDVVQIDFDSEDKSAHGARRSVSRDTPRPSDPGAASNGKGKERADVLDVIDLTSD